jgi:hypothetical protein
MVRPWRSKAHAEVIEKLNKEVNVSIADPKLQARLANLGGTALGGSRQTDLRRGQEVEQGDFGGQICGQYETVISRREPEMVCCCRLR